MESTQAAAVLDALVTTFRSSLTGVEVVDGQPLATNQPIVLVVGWSANRVGVEITQTKPDLSRSRRHETLSIACLASSARGDVRQTSVVRNEAVGLLDDVRTVLAANRNLGGLVRRVELGTELAMDQAQGDGAAVTIEFTVQAVTL